jgi:hypothetical protein
MKRIALTLIGAAALMLAGCDGTNDSLSNGQQNAVDPYTTGGGNNGQGHSQDPNGADPSASYPVADPAQKSLDDATAGSPDTVARLHSCGKVTVASLKSILATRGVNMGSTTAGSAGQLYSSGVAALGAANYGSRVPEASFATTSGATKQMDIFAAASSEVVMATWNPSACQSGGAAVKLFDASGNFTKDGISCLIGKPARDEHVALANAAVTQASTPAIGKQIAISALMSAAHTCE